MNIFNFIRKIIVDLIAFCVLSLLIKSLAFLLLGTLKGPNEFYNGEPCSSTFTKKLMKDVVFSVN